MRPPPRASREARRRRRSRRRRPDVPQDRPRRLDEQDVVLDRDQASDDPDDRDPGGQVEPAARLVRGSRPPSPSADPRSSASGTTCHRSGRPIPSASSSSRVDVDTATSALGVPGEPALGQHEGRVRRGCEVALEDVAVEGVDDPARPDAPGHAPAERPRFRHVGVDDVGLDPSHQAREVGDRSLVRGAGRAGGAGTRPGRTARRGPGGARPRPAPGSRRRASVSNPRARSAAESAST